jgi:hypothetical protein
MATPEGPIPAAGATPEGVTSAASPALMTAPEGLTASAAPMAAPKGATSAAGIGLPLPFPEHRTGREQGRDPSRRLEQGSDLDAGPPLPPLRPPVTADGRPRPTCITGNPFRITWLMLEDGMNTEIDSC